MRYFQGLGTVPDTVVNRKILLQVIEIQSSIPWPFYWVAPFIPQRKIRNVCLNSEASCVTQECLCKAPCCISWCCFHINPARGYTGTKRVNIINGSGICRPIQSDSHTECIWDGLQIWGITANVLNKHLPAEGGGGLLITSHHYRNDHVTKCYIHLILE
jgi:hypothetical protein